jgi:DNA-binding NarL/FixJ family response regulator
MSRPVNALIVDDEPHVIVLLRNLLKQLGIETVWEAADGAAAIEKAAANNPDVVLLDLNLPLMSGLEVLAKLKAANPKLPVIIVSAQGTLRTFDRARELGAEGYVLKFAPKSEILQMLSDTFDAIAGKSDGQASGGDEKPASVS